jgi:hypothetical protein
MFSRPPAGCRPEQRRVQPRRQSVEGARREGHLPAAALRLGELHDRSRLPDALHPGPRRYRGRHPSDQRARGEPYAPSAARRGAHRGGDRRPEGDRSRSTATSSSSRTPVRAARRSDRATRGDIGGRAADARIGLRWQAHGDHRGCAPPGSPEPLPAPGSRAERRDPAAAARCAAARRKSSRAPILSGAAASCEYGRMLGAAVGGHRA